MIHRRSSGQYRHRALRAGALALPLLLAICQALALVHALSHVHVPSHGEVLAFAAQPDVDAGLDAHTDCRQCVEFGQIASLLPSAGFVPGVVPQDALRFVAAAAELLVLEPRRRFLARAPPLVS